MDDKQSGSLSSLHRTKSSDSGVSSSGFFSLHRTKSQDNPTGQRRRGSSVSSGSNWFKKLGSRISHNEPDAERKGSVGSIFSSSSQDSDTTPEPAAPRHTSSFTGNLLRRVQSRDRENSVSSLSNQQQLQHQQQQNLLKQQQQQKQQTPRAQGAQSAQSPVSPTKRAQPTDKDEDTDSDEKASNVTLSDLKKRKIGTRSVGFAISTFADNPPQRIPPASPSEGNIKFTDNGEAVVRTLARSHYSADSLSCERNHAELARIAQAKARQNAERLHASMTSNTFSSLFQRHNNNHKDSVGDIADEEEIPTNRFIATHDVDGTKNVKSMKTGFAGAGAGSEDDDNDTDWESREFVGGQSVPPPDQVYIRCCHLREIMPIRNILRQLQGQLAPIPRVRIANTKPTLVEIQAFSDFLTVVPVSSLVLDNHILTDEMLRLIFVGIQRSRDIARITFVNTKLGVLGWQYLCLFLASSRKSLLALNLSCTDPTGIPHRIEAFNRANMPWKLLSEALAAMGSLEELDLGGTKIPGDDLRHLMLNGFKRGRILGLANNNLNNHDVKFIADWAELPDSQLMGVNLSGNDLSKEEDWAIVQRFLTNPRIFQLSLRNSRLSHIHASHFVRAISVEQARKSQLRQLDLSYNPELFPAITRRLTSVLPQFPYLSRLQIEHCGLDSDTIVALCESLSHCHRLVYLSVAGNGQLTETAATALCVAVHMSRSICTVEADISEDNVALRQQLARYCIQNLEKNAGNYAGQPEPSEDDNHDIGTFQEELRAVANIVNSGNHDLRDCAGVVERIEEMRNRIKLRMHSLLIKRRNGPLSVRDREATMRLFFYSTNLDRLKREASDGAKHQEPTGTAEEAVKNVGEEDVVRPSLERSNSQASIASLKNMEREEGESHKAYAKKLMDLDDDGMLDAVGKLKVQDLEQIMN